MSTGCRAAGSVRSGRSARSIWGRPLPPRLGWEVDELGKSKRVKRKGGSLGNQVQKPLQRRVVDPDHRVGCFDSLIGPTLFEEARRDERPREASCDAQV